MSPHGPLWASALLALARAALAPAAPSTDLTTRCAAVASIHWLPNTTVWFAHPVAAGTNLSFPDNHPTCNRASQVVEAAICRVAMLVTTSPTSNVSLEAWLPLGGGWTGRFLATGNGGVGGCIQYEDMAYAAALGFATVGASTGHNGSSAAPLLHNAGAVEDFAYRSVHAAVVLGKALTAAFYGRPHTKSYFLGCSTGGRQGFKAAQAFPDDFDGILAGAPALDFMNLNSWSGSFYIKTGPPGSPSFVPPALWTDLVHADVLRQCDALDGIADGIIEDASRCQYDPTNLVCGLSPTTACLTARQVQTVRDVLSPLRRADGALVYPRMQPGTEQTALSLYYAGAPFAYATEWYRYVVYNDPAWDPSRLGGADVAYAAALDPFGVATWDGDLGRARDRGVKILHYHGQADMVVTSEISPRYYDHVAATMGATPAQLDAFYRFFRVGGMGHCAGGAGAVHIGNTAAQTATLDPDGNVLMALVRWVEQGTAPDTITGVAWRNGSAALGVDFTRRHCRYPASNQYRGMGDPKSADSWVCARP